MGGFQYIAFIIPILLSLVALEWLISRKKGIKVYTLSDTMVNICCGILERLFDFFYVTLMYFVFIWLYANASLWHIQVNAFTWILALMAGDILAYWHHRLSHEINFLWAAHIVHHQSEELNLTTVFRVSAFAVINRLFFFMWMPILGFDPIMTTSVIVFIGLFQFVTHSRLVGKLGFLELIFVTPSHHRVHHARNEKYLDTNYGHVFIFWDKLFGTFKPEEEEPEYGITSGFASGNPYRAYFAYWQNLFRRSREARKFSDKLKVFIKPPGWVPEGVSPTPPEFPVDSHGNRMKYNLTTPFKLQLYVFINIIITLTLFIILFILKQKIQPATVTALIFNPMIIQLVFIILISILSYGMILDRKSWAFTFEILRLVLVAAFTANIFRQVQNGSLILLVAIVVMSIMTVWFFSLRHLFKKNITSGNSNTTLLKDKGNLNY